MPSFCYESSLLDCFLAIHRATKVSWCIIFNATVGRRMGCLEPRASYTYSTRFTRWSLGSITTDQSLFTAGNARANPRVIYAVLRYI